MTVVLIHGIPENAEIWSPLLPHLQTSARALNLPGIASTPSADWSGTKDELAAWVDAELARFEPPIDVVAHDLGALLMMRLAFVGRTEVRSWIVDVPDLFAPDARFAPTMQQLQHSDDAGEDLRRRSALPVDDPGSWAGSLRAGGAPAALARRIAERHAQVTDDAIIAFYRSASPNVAADWWPSNGQHTRGRGLVLLLPDPPEVEARSHRTAARLDATTAALQAGHCWMASDPTASAALIRAHWSTLED